jgi:hypothetical protein
MRTIMPCKPNCDTSSYYKTLVVVIQLPDCDTESLGSDTAEVLILYYRSIKNVRCSTTSHIVRCIQATTTDCRAASFNLERNDSGLIFLGWRVGVWNEVTSL